MQERIIHSFIAHDKYQTLEKDKAKQHNKSQFERKMNWDFDPQHSAFQAGALPTDLPRQLSSSNCNAAIYQGRYTQVSDIPLSFSTVYTISILKYFLLSLSTLYTANHYKGISTSLILLKEWNSVNVLQMLRYDAMSTILCTCTYRLSRHCFFHCREFNHNYIYTYAMLPNLRTMCFTIFSRYLACYPTLCLYPALC